MWGTVHGPWCGTRIWPTRCPSCGSHVFFFMCDCGSKVFFDERGAPWPLHDCDTSWTRTLKRTTDKTGKITVELGPGITVSRPTSDSFGIEVGILSRARAAHAKRTPDAIVGINPTAGERKLVVGILREIARSANPIKTFRLADTIIANAGLGPIGAQPVGKLTVHVPMPSVGPLQSFTVWIPTELLKERRIVRGITVSLCIDSIQVLGRGHAWFCDEFEVVG